MATQVFELLGTTGGIDEHGIASFSVPYFCETFADIFTCGASAYNGVAYVSRTFKANDDGTFTATLLYEGANPAQPPPGRDDPTFTLSSTYQDEAIEAHPCIMDLLKIYGGHIVDGRASFPETLPDKTEKGGLTNANAKSAESTRNPMFGVEKYPALSISWEVAYAAKVIPADVVARVGTEITNPPGNPPKIHGRTKWLVMPPSVSKRGNLVEVKEVYQLQLPGIAPELFRLL